MISDDDPSFEMESKPRINAIDFITYIFGALGSWIGFSFLVINPVPWVLKTRNKTTQDQDQSCSATSLTVFKIKQTSNRMKAKIKNVDSQRSYNGPGARSSGKRGLWNGKKDGIN